MSYDSVFKVYMFRLNKENARLYRIWTPRIQGRFTRRAIYRLSIILYHIFRSESSETSYPL